MGTSTKGTWYRGLSLRRNKKQKNRSTCLGKHRAHAWTDWESLGDRFKTRVCQLCGLRNYHTASGGHS